jgi:hypothetical protein
LHELATAILVDDLMRRPRAHARERRPHGARRRQRRSTRGPPADDEPPPPLARQPLASARLFLDAWGIWPWSGWERLAAEAETTERDAYLRASSTYSVGRP